MPNYEAADLHLEIDDFSLIRRTFGPEMSGEQLAGQLVRDLILTGSLPCGVDYIDGWWVVSSEKDWLLKPSGSITLRSSNTSFTFLKPDERLVIARFY